MVRPTIMLMIRSIEASFVSTVAMYWPSRMTVTRSEISFSSSSRCEMCTTPTPFVLTARIMRKSFDLGVRERRGGLVHDQDLRAVRERLRDLDHLLLCDAEFPDLGLRIDLQIEALEKGPSL